MWTPRSVEKEFKALPTSKSKDKREILMQPQVGTQKHSFYPTLRQWGTKGVPVNCGPDWDRRIIKQAVARGPHHSALDLEHTATVKENIRYQVVAGF